jgi:hypothetical protein
MYELGFYIREDGIPHSHCREVPRILQQQGLLYTFVLI